MPGAALRAQPAARSAEVVPVFRRQVTEAARPGRKHQPAMQRHFAQHQKLLGGRRGLAEAVDGVHRFLQFVRRGDHDSEGVVDLFGECDEVLEFVLQIGGALAIGCRGLGVLGCGELVVGGFDGGVDAGQLAGVRRGFGVELVEAGAGFLVAIGVGVIGDDAALLDRAGRRVRRGLLVCFRSFSIVCSIVACLFVPFVVRSDPSDCRRDSC